MKLSSAMVKSYGLKGVFLFLMFWGLSLSVHAQNLYTEGADLANTGTGPTYNITVAGTYTVIGTLMTTADGQDRFQVNVATGLSLSNVAYNISGGGFNGNINFAGIGQYAGPGPGSGTISLFSGWSYPLPAGTYGTILAANFSTGSSWTMTFTVTGTPTGTAPSITGNPPNRTICAGGNTTFGVTASNATGYQWQVNTGSGFGNISNGGVYSGATTSTLTITGATAGMNGYLYRAIASGSVSPNATSNNGTLTVASIGTTGSQTNLSCNGGANGSATVVASGGITPYSYSWSPSGGTGATATGLAAGNYTVTVTDNIGCTTTRNYTLTQPTAITAITSSQTNIACNGGSNGAATITASGGTPGYTYSWSPSGGTATSISGRTAGTYTATITDAIGCTGTKTVTLTQPPALTATTSQTNVSCNGGSNGTATVTVGGGTPGYTYSWSPSGGTAATATGLSVGTYTVTVTDANSCQLTRTFTITQPTALVATPSAQTNIACNGGSTGAATVAASGGTPGYSYSWSPSGGTAATATGLSAGTYTVTVTDANSCQATANFTLTQPTAMTVISSSQTNIACNGGSTGAASVTVSGGTGGYTYSWSPSGGTAATATGLSAGTYTVTVTDDNGCQLTRTFTITQPTAITVVSSSQTNIACNGGSTGAASVTVSGGTPGYMYSWSPSGGSAATATGLSAGTYSVTVTDANGCQLTRTFTITQPTALTATTSQTNVSCNGGSNGTASVTVGGGTPGYMYSWSPSGGTGATATGLSAGTYTVTVTDANSCQLTRTFTITQPTAMAVVSSSQTNIACNGGTTGAASVTVGGGTPGYTYLWSPSGGTAATATGLAAGTYTVTVTDANSCQTTANFTLTQPTAMTFTSSSQTNIACNGGSTGAASVTVGGGTPGYMYSWSPSGGTAATATGLSAGTYTVTVTDGNSCQLTRTFTITQPTALAATTSQTNVSCNGGSNGTATVTVNGGTPGYTYLWSPSGGSAATATGLAAGTYTVTVTDANSCQLTRTFTITQPTALTATPSQTNVSCNGGSNGTATVAVNGGTPGYTYLWSPSGGTAATATGLAAGTYTVTIADANLCSITQSVTVSQPTALSLVSGSQTNVSCFGLNDGSATVNPAGGTPGYTYLWSPSGGTAATASNLAIGTYTVTVTDGNNCSDTRSFTITQPPAIAQYNVTGGGAYCAGGAGVAIGVNGSETNTVYELYNNGIATGTTTTGTGAAITFGNQTAAGTYSVLATNTNTGCTRLMIGTVAVIINPIPDVNTIPNQALCDGASTTAVTFSGAVSGTSFAWTNNTTPIGLAASGNGNIPSFVAVNATNAPVVATVTVTPTANSCVGSSKTFTITVNPIPDVNAVADQTLCNNSATMPVAFSGAVSGTSYAWTNTLSSIGLAGAGNGNIASFTATNTTPAPVTATITVTPSANGCTGSSTSFNITVNPTPMLTSVLTAAPICNNTTFSYTPTSATTGTTFAWSRALVAGISTPAAAGTDDPNEILENTTADPIAVTYTYTLTANGCVNTQDVTVVVNPTPQLNSGLVGSPICDNSVFAYTPTSATAGTSFAWTRPVVAGISNPAGSGTGNISEVLSNATPLPVTVTYNYTLTANGCSNTQDVTVVVNPTPQLNSPVTAIVCSGDEFNYTTSTSTPGTVITWMRAQVAGITPNTGSGTYTINETLTNSTSQDINVVYTFTLMANGCTYTQNLTLTVRATPQMAVIAIKPEANLCKQTMYQNFGAATPPPAGANYVWTASNAVVWAQSGSSAQNALISFPNGGTSIVTLTTTVNSTGCASKATYTVNVNPEKAQQPEVIYYNKRFICLQNDVQSYMWGYDDRNTLDSSVIEKEIQQDYYNPAPDFTNRNYWVMTMKNGCMQKSYYNVPTEVANVSKTAPEVRVYPNPATEIVNIAVSGNQGILTYEIYELSGKRLKSGEIINNAAQISVTDIPSGVYMITTSKEGVRFNTSRFIKN